MVAPRRVYLPASAFALLVLACSEEAPPGSPLAETIQITGVLATPTNVPCKGGPERIVGMNIRIINTTRSDAIITKLSSSGVVVASSEASLLGQRAYVFSSVPFTPDSIQLVAKTGDQVITAQMTAQCIVVNFAVPTYTDVLMTLQVETTRGYFIATPFTLRLDATH